MPLEIQNEFLSVVVFSTCKNGMLWPLKSRNISSKCVEQLSELWKTSRFTFAARYFTASFQNGKLLRRNIFSLEFKTNIVWTSEGQIKKVCRDVCSSSSMLGKTFLVADLDVDMLWQWDELRKTFTLGQQWACPYISCSPDLQQQTINYKWTK